MINYDLDLKFNPTILQKRASLFKPTSKDAEILKKVAENFIKSTKQQNCVADASFTWERHSYGYRINDLEIERIDEIFDLLKEYYFCSNKSYLATNLYMDTYIIKTYQQFILDTIADNNSFCALEEGTGKIIGVAIASLSLAFDDNMENHPSARHSGVFDVLKFRYSLLSQANISATYDVDKYFCIHIICVKPDYYDYGVGTSLVRTCLSKAQKKRYPLCIGIFPAGPTYTIAEKFGFTLLKKMLWMNIYSSKLNNRTMCNSSKANAIEKSYVACMAFLTPINEENMSSSEESMI